MLSSVERLKWVGWLFRATQCAMIVAAFGGFMCGETTIRAADPVAIQLETVGSMSPRNQAAWWSPIAHHNGSIYLSHLSSKSPEDDVYVAKRDSLGAWTVHDTGVNARYDVGHT